MMNIIEASKYYIAGIKTNIKNKAKAIRSMQIDIEIIETVLFLFRIPIVKPKTATINKNNKIIVKLNFILRSKYNKKCRLYNKLEFGERFSCSHITKIFYNNP